jgi:hypothetical protein
MLLYTAITQEGTVSLETRLDTIVRQSTIRIYDFHQLKVQQRGRMHNPRCGTAAPRKWDRKCS